MAQANPAVTLSQDQLQQLIDGIQHVNRGGTRRVSILTSTDAADWRIWRENFTVIADINGWNDERKKREATAALEGEAKKCVMDIRYQNAANITTLLDQFEARFVTQASSDMARVNFINAKQRPDETILAWHARVREAFIRAHPQLVVATAQALIDRFILGLINSKVIEYVWDQRPTTFSEALDLASNKMASLTVIANRNKAAQVGGATMPQVKLEPGVHNVQQHSPTKRYGNIGGGAPHYDSCWFCGQRGHAKRDCMLLTRARQALGGSNTQKQTNSTHPAGGAKKKTFRSSPAQAANINFVSPPIPSEQETPPVEDRPLNPDLPVLIEEEDENGEGENIWSFPPRTHGYLGN